ncbi:unnamed protein product [Effrenium voratum]|nr:unnamed protein product [Effrenium voratum]
MLEGELAVLTSRGDDFSQLLDIRPDIPVELQRLEGYSLLMRHFPEQGLLLQVTENSLLVYGGEGSWELLHRQRLDPFCNHAAACKGQAFTACGAVLSRYEVSRSGITRSETKVLQDQVSALAITSCEPLCAGLWLSKVILVLDTKTLEELQRFPVPTRICSMHVVIDPGGWALWAGSAQGHLLRHSQGEGASWRLGASPLRLRPATGAAEALAVSAEGAFLLATAGDFTPCLWPSDLVFAHPCGDKKMLVLSRGSGGLVLAKAPITAKREAHRVLRSTKLCGEVLSLAFKADPPAILVLAQLAAKERRLALLTLDRHLQLLALVPLEDEAKRLWPLGRPSSWLYDLSWARRVPPDVAAQSAASCEAGTLAAARNHRQSRGLLALGHAGTARSYCGSWCAGGSGHHLPALRLFHAAEPREVPAQRPGPGAIAAAGAEPHCRQAGKLATSGPSGFRRYPLRLPGPGSWSDDPAAEAARRRGACLHPSPLGPGAFADAFVISGAGVSGARLAAAVRLLCRGCLGQQHLAFGLQRWAAGAAIGPRQVRPAPS